ncbi:signal peptidase [Frigidibacter albus]|uniref:Signal peptidase n=1 Tax=Frigidibacter albus TaxID=1465486 RepID=A0A6L8VEJ9_9RHOB|nr:imelysin family protein [Frigidibacter albus]MZQ88715.1 signal peptidase [Frigidibacter albus]NBE30476.1 signal peptidase [Frigidibacter albus]GGH50036.1 signal peptidase [Frigidibacter albus]
MKILVALLALAAPAAADPVVDRVVTGTILPRFAAFSEATAALEDAAAADCLATSPDLRAAWNAAFDAWLPASTFRIGPLEQEGRGLAIAFWPDPKGATDRALAALLAGDGAPLASGQTYAEVSVAARGLYALEAMLYDPDLNSYTEADPGCALTRAAAADLAALAAGVEADWRTDFAPLLQTAGAPGNTRFLSAHEARQAVFTQLVTQLGFDAETRVGRPLGSITRPRPLRAESRAAGRSLRNVTLSLAANRALAEALTDGGTEYLFAYFDYAQGVAARLDDPIFAGVDSPSGRLKIEELKTAIERVQDAASAELAAELGVAAGFNALDGD